MLILFRKSLCIALAAATPLWGAPSRLLASDPGRTTTAPQASNDAPPAGLMEMEAVPVRLSADRQMRGEAKTVEGKPASGATVVLGVNGKPVGRVIADEQGRFTFGPLKPGRYQLATTEAVAMVDVFPATDAPEKAVQSIEVSQPAMIARGQNARAWLTNPWFLGLVIAAAIAIPLAIALDDDDDDDAS